MAQNFTSRATAVNGKAGKFPAIYKKIDFEGLAVLDIGCGRYTDYINDFVTAEGGYWYGVDPYNKTASHNMQTFAVWLVARSRACVAVLCACVCMYLFCVADGGGVAVSMYICRYCACVVWCGGLLMLCCAWIYLYRDGLRSCSCIHLQAIALYPKIKQFLRINAIYMQKTIKSRIFLYGYMQNDSKNQNQKSRLHLCNIYIPSRKSKSKFKQYI